MYRRYYCKGQISKPSPVEFVKIEKIVRDQFRPLRTAHQVATRYKQGYNGLLISERLVIPRRIATMASVLTNDGKGSGQLGEFVWGYEFYCDQCKHRLVCISNAEASVIFEPIEV